ncbi:ribokinase [Bacillus canaveralius]|uniref:Ribokinase n=1 Tax=Bacillus canaveralius TaxID=1403243 RepID=A0A2N5GK40_9BACI|nr:ribokinase [Bacillus canaveralius]PLR89904.1 ribokinase [Bacillus canaveralius]
MKGESVCLIKTDVIVIGTINIDLVAYVSRFPDIGETLASIDFRQIPGGKAANQAVAAQRLGKQVALVGKVGKDPYASLLKEKFLEEGISLDYVFSSEKTATGSSLIIVDHAGQNMIITNQNANKELTKEEVLASLETAHGAGAALLQLEMPLDVANTIILALKKINIPIFLNLAPVVAIDPQIRRLVDFLIINEVEAGQITGFSVSNIANAKLAVKQLLEEGHSQVVLTLGAEGAIIGDKNGIYQVPSPKVHPVDTTAAGDCFCGALVTYWLEEKDLLQATKKAVVAAAISVTRKGAQPSLPNQKEVEGFIKKGDYEK